VASVQNGRQLSIVAEHSNLTILHLTAGVIITQRGIVGRLPIYNQSTRNIVEIAIVTLSKVCLGFIPTTEAFITTFDVRNATHLTDQGINGIIPDRFTTTHILFIIVAKIIFVVGIDELQHIIQSIVILQTLIDELYSLRVQNFFVVRSESDAHVVCLVDSVSMAPLGGVWEVWWTVWRLSHAVQKIMQRLHIVCLSLKDPTMNSTGVLRLRGRGSRQIPTLCQDLLSVGGVSGLFHEISMAPLGAVWWVWWSVAKLSQPT
jgi:hypothetical protein